MKDHRYFKVKHWNDRNKANVFIFVGNDFDKDTRDILFSIEAKQSVGHLLKKDQEQLQAVFGRRYESTLGFKEFQKNKVQYVMTLINPDDNINWLKRKLFYHLQKNIPLNTHEDIYMWINKKFHTNIAIFQAFITNCFKLEKRISIQYFSQCVSNYFGVDLGMQNKSAFIDKNQAFSYIEDIEEATHAEPVFFKYTNDIYYEYVNYNPLKTSSENVDKLTTSSFDSLLLESFGVDDITDEYLHIVSYNALKTIFENEKIVSKYFPFSSNKNKKPIDSTSTITTFVEAIEKVEDRIKNYKTTEGYLSSAFTSFLHVRTNELNFNPRQDLEPLFEALTTSNGMPFIKYKAVNNNYYKVNKESMVKLKNELLGKWTETKVSQSFGKTTETSYILLKIHYKKDVYCSLLIFDNMCYDLKFTFGSMMRETEKDIIQFLEVIDNIISRVKSIYPDCDIPYIDRDFTKSVSHTGNTKVLRWLTTNNIKSDKIIINYNNFNTVLQNRLFSYFNIIRNPNKNILHLQYKKVENYLNYEVIQVFITNHFVKDRVEMIKKITNEFVISSEDAEKELEKWLSQNEIEILKMGDKIFIKPRSDNFVNVKIRLTSSIDLNFNIEGAKSSNIQERIIRLLCVLMDMSNSKIIDKSNVAINKVDSFLYGQKATNTSSSTASSSIVKTRKSVNSSHAVDDFDNLDMELNDFADYDEFGELFEDDEELRALELEFMKEAQQATSSTSALKPQQGDEDGDDDKKPKDEDSIMKSYFMNMLKSADRDLIDYKVPKGQKLEKRYSTVCQWNDRRQPVVVNKGELDNIKKFQSDIRYIKTGSTPELQEKNFYICPQVWCPKSKIAMKYKDFKEKYNEQCPYPEIEEKPILLTNHYWGKGDKGLSREHYPGFLDAFKTHPKKFCLPCCFKKEAKEGNKNKQKENTCKNQWSTEAPQEDELEVFGNEKYIKGEIFVPLEASRYGLLPKEVNELLGNQLCGNGFDGKGLMSDKTNCILRKGINQKSQSFVSALISLLDNPNITSVSSFVDHFNANISIEQFISLENGKVMKLFINREYDIYNPSNFNEFINWITDKEQKAYVKSFKLKPIVEELLSLPAKNRVFNPQILKKAKHVLREFLIFNAYNHFVKYINDMSVEKNHNLLIDYVQTENSWLNTQHYNIVIIEHEPTENKTHMICPFNRNAKKVFDTADPFIFIFKQNNYYEPLCHVRIVRGDIDAQTKFILKTAPQPIKNLLNFYLQNCSIETNENTALDVELYLGTITGRKIKRYVIDYSFRVCGFLVSGINLFVPLNNKVDIYDLKQTEFIYYDEVSSYKCILDESNLQEIFLKLYKRTGDDFYKLARILYSDDNTNRIVGLILNKNYFVPINYNDTKDLKYVNDLLEDDLNIFIEHEKIDERAIRIKRDQQRKQSFRVFLDQVAQFIEKSKVLQQELNFLMDKENPFPKSYRRKKLVELVQKVIVKTEFVSIVGKNMDLKQFTSNYVEELLTANSGNTHDIMLRQMFGVKKNFKKEVNEIVFDQKNVIDGKLAEKIRFIQNPYASLMDRLDKYVREYVFDGYEHDDLNAFKRYLNVSTVFEDVPYKFRRILQDYKLISYGENTTKYTNNTMYDIFLGICKAKGMTHITDVSVLKMYVQRQIMQGFKLNALEEMYSNPSYIHNMKLMKLKTNTLDNIMSVVDSMNYYPSEFELMMLVKIAQVRVIVVGRKTKDNEQGIAMYPDQYQSKYNRYIVMHQSYDRFNNHDIYQLAVVGSTTKTPKIIMRKHEVSESLLKLVKMV
jgi:hypothetical protein